MLRNGRSGEQLNSESLNGRVTPIKVYWYIGILDKHYLFLRFLDPSQVTIADWMPFELLKRCAHVQYVVAQTGCIPFDLLKRCPDM